MINAVITDRVELSAITGGIRTITGTSAHIFVFTAVPMDLALSRQPDNFQHLVPDISIRDYHQY
ncbi:hypothetical protein DERF_014331 [Dermatophagoides farinae]|uniref:Uncharacterized protein n=1 Tax=Dermatophagoides farinae TaxID=6954 RepID=A0A922HLP9_DERFA|nr:hypothetical protein DERF_014331 [Dermatophagoides farinae]